MAQEKDIEEKDIKSELNNDEQKDLNNQTPESQSPDSSDNGKATPAGGSELTEDKEITDKKETPEEESEPSLSVEENTNAPALKEEAVSSAEEKETETNSEAEELSQDAAHKLESEHDLKEKDDDDDHEDEDVDYSNLSKKELVDVIKELARADNVIQAERKAREVKHFFDEFREKEREEALEKFKAEGGEEGDFSFRPDELTVRFDANFQLIRDRKHDYTKDREKKKDENLKKKQDILERLREFVDSEETNISFENFKKFQEEWKSTGPVPGSYARTLWANYNALIDRFYDNRSIYFELKELDRRKNLESKLELCVRAEELLKMEQVTEAVKELNELHHEFKHIGPVPKEEQEPLWTRFKAASDAIYDRRKAFVEKLKGELEGNMKIKSELADKVAEFGEFDSDRIKAWNAKTKEILDIQKKWENTGGLPRAHAKEINKKFWSNFKTFFSNKNQFFKKLDAEREENLEKKRTMVQKALELKDNEDMQSTAEKLKQLQREWREVGPVPGKYRESVYKEFKSACDEFFERKRASRDEASKEYVENYEKKKSICKNI
jgi:hypothetical protein